MLESLPAFSDWTTSGVCSDTEPVVTGACSSICFFCWGDYNWHVSKSQMTIRRARLIGFPGANFTGTLSSEVYCVQGHDCEQKTV